VGITTIAFFCTHYARSHTVLRPWPNTILVSRPQSGLTEQVPASPSGTNKSATCSDFFSNGFSVFEAFCFALFAVGALTGSAEFPLATDADERRVEWNSMKQAYGRAFPGDPILSVLKTIANDTAFKKFRDDRGILTHRAVPPRTFNVTAGPSTVPESTTIERLNMPFDTETTRRDADTWQGF
jgi:hypothetical protein